MNYYTKTYYLKLLAFYGGIIILTLESPTLGIIAMAGTVGYAIGHTIDK